MYKKPRKPTQINQTKTPTKLSGILSPFNVRGIERQNHEVYSQGCAGETLGNVVIYLQRQVKEPSFLCPCLLQALMDWHGVTPKHLIRGGEDEGKDR